MEKTKEMSHKVSAFVSSILDKGNELFQENKEKATWILGIVYKLFLDVYFVSVVSRYWSSDGLFFKWSLFNYFFSWVFYVVGYWLIKRVKNHLLAFFLHLQWILSVAPVLVLFGLQAHRSFIYPLLVMAVLLLQVIFAMSKKKFIPISFGKEKVSQYVNVALCVMVVVVWIVMAFYNSFEGIKAFDFNYIYEMRARLVYPPMFGYLVRWVTGGALPWLLMAGVVYKKAFYVTYSLIFQLLYYMLMGIKGPLFMTVVLLIVFLICKFRMQFWGTYTGLNLGLFAGTLCGMSKTIGRIGPILAFNAMLGERTLFFPAINKYWFFEFFSEYPKTFFSDGMIGKFLSLSNLYNDRLGRVIYTYTLDNGYQVEANTGYLGDSYAQMGIAGMLIIGAFLILMIRFIANYEGYIPNEILYGIIAIFVITLNDNAFFTSLLTGGFWVILVLLIFNAKKTEDKSI